MWNNNHGISKSQSPLVIFQDTASEETVKGKYQPLHLVDLTPIFESHCYSGLEVFAISQNKYKLSATSFLNSLGFLWRLNIVSFTTTPFVTRPYLTARGNPVHNFCSRIVKHTQQTQLLKRIRPITCLQTVLPKPCSLLLVTYLEDTAHSRIGVCQDEL